MLHGEVQNSLEERYLYDRIKMKKTLEMQKSVQGGHMTTQNEPWSPINRGVPLPLATPWHKRSKIGDGKVVMQCSGVMIEQPHKKYKCRLMLYQVELSIKI